MRKTSFMCLAVAIGLVACHDPMGVPAAPEPLAVTVNTRSPIQGEAIPLVRIIPGIAIVTFEVNRPGLCATRVEAGLGREPGDLVVVTHVSADPAAFCSGVVTVVNYWGQITGLEGGSYRVRVFEAEEMGNPRLIGSAVVSVTANDYYHI